MTINFTENQKRAIDIKDANIIVSAAAGSGKTAVLVERILKQVIEDKVDITEFLVVTFTKLAASEMKEKIISKLNQKIIETQDKSHLQKQLDYINFAKINTVHAFCFEIIREYFLELDVSPDFSIISGTEEKILKESIMSDVITNFFNEFDTNSDEFINFITAVDKKNIEKEMINLYNFLFSYSKPFDVIDNTIEHYKTLAVAENSSILDELIYNFEPKTYALNALKHASDLCLAALKIVKNFPQSKNLTIISDELQFITSLQDELIKNGYIKAFELFSSYKFVRFASKGDVDSYFHDKMKEFRDKYKKILNEKTFLLIPLDIDEANLQANTQVCNTNFIKKIISYFHTNFEKIKKLKNILVFSDAEHKMVELLENEKICDEISSRFREIMIDEYQDTNEIQDTIFAKLSKKNSKRFMVGDLKQSIYRFRFADPFIFTQKLDTFTFENSDNVKVCLNNNFRSKSDVVTSINLIFNKIMTRFSGGVDYNTQEQQLVFSAPYFRDDTKKTELIIVDRDKIDLKKEEIEGTVIAKRICELIASKTEVFDSGSYRPIQYNDIVILMRAVSSKAYFYKKTFEKAGIPVDFQSDVSAVFNTPEILVLIDFLKVIDNKMNKNSLIAILKSEIFGFSNNEILFIDNFTDKSFYYSMKSIAENANQSTEISSNFQQKCEVILSFIDELYQYSKFNSVFFTLWKIISKFDVIAKFTVLNFGEIRQKNIKLFLDFAESFGDDSNLYDFLNTCENIDSNTKLSAATSSVGAVEIMSIHKSKGLEFPVVFVADLAKKFNDLDKRSDILKSSSLGIATRHVEARGFIKYNSIFADVINLKNDRESTAEEMRILYVALTRAKEKLILVGTVPKFIGKDGVSTKLNNWILDPTAVSSYLDWIAPTVLKSKSAMIFDKFCSEVSANIDETDDTFECYYVNEVNEITATTKGDEYTPQEIFEYQIATKIDVPSKVSPSSIQEFNVVDLKNTTDKVLFYPKPKFILDRGITPAEKGIAHHTVMQFIDFKHAYTRDGISLELLRLLEQKFISQVQYDAINVDSIYQFFKSDIGLKLKDCEVYREFNFSVLVDSAELLDTNSSGKTLFQGIIDCMYLEDGKMHIIDFKTDSIKTYEDMKNATAHHKFQVDLYEKAIFEVFNIYVGSKKLYYFSNQMFDEI